MCIRDDRMADYQCNILHTSKLHGHLILYIGYMRHMVMVCRDFVWLLELFFFEV